MFGRQTEPTHSHKMYSVRDSKGEFYYPPAFHKTHGEAERSFLNVAKNPESIIGKNPEDYDLYYVGNYDEQTGKLYPTSSPEHIAKANALKL